MKRMRSFQLDCVNKILGILDSGQDPLLISPTGSGKTAMWCKVIKTLSKRDRAHKFLVIVPRKSLVVQAMDELAEWQIDAGAIAGNFPESKRATVQVATYQSLASRDIDWLKPDYTVLDEAHLSAFPKSVKAWIPTVSDYWLHKNRTIGVTATPRRSNKHTSLGELFLPDNIVFAPKIADLIRMGYLVRPSYGVCPNAVTKKMMFDPDYILATYRSTDRRPTIVFAPSVPKAVMMANRFNAEGIKARVVTGNTSTDDRRVIFSEFNAEDLPVIVNCCVLREGIDLPIATNLILAIDPDSHSSYVQCIGRVLRPATYKDGSKKTHATIYDVTGCVERHGRVEELEYTADDIQLPDIEFGEVPMKSCPKEDCDIKSYISARFCRCGCEFEIKKRRTVIPEGNVFALLNSDEREHKAIYEELLLEAFERGDRPQAARVEFYNRYRYTPPILWRQNFRPSPEIEGWLLTEGLRLNADWRSRQLALPL